MNSKLKIIRKKTGNFLEDFEPGQVFRHKGGKTVTEGLFTTFTEFAMTTNPFAKNARYARAYGFQGLVCPPGLVMLVAFSQTVEDVSENARANLEYIDMRFGAPVYVGDTIEVETKVIGVRPSSSRPNLGIVHVQSTARKNVGCDDEAVVLTWQRKVQVYKQDADAELHAGEIEPDEIECELWLPKYDPSADYKALSHLSSPDSYFEDFEPGTRIEHSRGRTMTARPASVRGRPADHLRWDPLRAVPGAVVPRRGRQRPRRPGLRDGPPHGAAVRRRHGLRGHGDPRQARPPDARRPRHPRGAPAGP